jgi:hypothetical protein
VEDEERLGWKTTSKLFRVRDAYLLQRQPLRRFNRYSQVDMLDCIVTPLVLKTFAEELEAADWSE